MVWLRLRSWHGEKAPGFVGDVVEVDKAAALADDVEEIAMFAGGGVGPFAGRALAGFRSFQPDEHRAAGRVADVADQPVAAFAAAVGEIVAAHRLGIARETVRQFGGVTDMVMPPPARRCARADSAPAPSPGWRARGVGRHEHAQLPGDDLVEEAVGAQAVAHGVGEAGQLDAVGAHDADAAKLEPFGEIEDGPAVHQRREGVVGRQR